MLNTSAYCVCVKCDNPHSYFFHVAGAKSSSIGISSRRPASISNVSTSFEGIEKKPKFAAGPTSPRPGPTLFIAADTAVNFVVKSQFSNEMDVL